MVNNKIYGLLGIAAKAGKVISGTDLVLETMQKKQVALVIVAEDASEKTIKNMRFYSEKENVEMIIFGDIFTNSKSIGKQNRAIIGVKDQKLAAAIKKELNNCI